MTLQLILVNQIRAETQPNVSNFNKVDSSAVVKKDGKELYVMEILTIALNNHVVSEQTAPILLTTIGVNVHRDLVERDVKIKLTCV